MGFGVRKLSRRVIIPPFLPGKTGTCVREAAGRKLSRWVFYVKSGLRSAEIIPPARRGPAGQLAGRQAGAWRGSIILEPGDCSVVARRKPCTVCAAYAQSARPSKLGSICCTHRWWWLAVLVRKPDGALQTVGRTKRREVAHLIAPDF